MRFLKRGLVFLFFAFVGGCGDRNDPGPPNMMPNILGALRIADTKERDSALATACRESAEQGSAPAALMGIARIEDVNLRDRIAEECAMTLGEAGQTEAAVELAKLISNEHRRHELLAKLNAD